MMRESTRMKDGTQMKGGRKESSCILTGTRTGRRLGLYIHIPFCVQKCLYCDFLSAPAGEGERERYVEALCREIVREGKTYADYTVRTIYIGGGTPSLLSGDLILRILTLVYRSFRVEKDCEISLEANPGTVTDDKLKDWRRAGINRISLGAQSLQDEELKALGRIHDSQTFLDTYNMIIESGFNNINIDLMSGIPCQSLDSYRDTLEKVVSLKKRPPHISAYGLIVEEGTPFFENTPQLPDEDCEREMYALTGELLAKFGYCRYEISNYALPGYECRHNIGYWRRENYLGLGLGAASLIENVRFRNSRDMRRYEQMQELSRESGQGQEKALPGGSRQGQEKALPGGSRQGQEKTLSGGSEAFHKEQQVLSIEEQMEEFMFLGLRMTKGVSREEFFRAFGRDIDEVYPGIVENFCKKGLLRERKDDETGGAWLSLTDYGMDISNYVMADFLLTV